jgi:hypothetical protein
MKKGRCGRKDGRKDGRIGYGQGGKGEGGKVWKEGDVAKEGRKEGR